MMQTATHSWQDRARARMDALGLTQEDLLETLGVATRGAVGHYLSGRREPSIGQFDALAKKLGFSSMDELLNGAPAPAHPRVLTDQRPPYDPQSATEADSAYLAIRSDQVLVRELLAGVLAPLGLRVSRFDIHNENGLVIEAKWSGVPQEHQRGLPGEIKRVVPPGGRGRAIR